MFRGLIDSNIGITIRESLRTVMQSEPQDPGRAAEQAAGRADARSTSGTSASRAP